MADINGTDSGETLTGTTGNDAINGLGGDDTILGKGGYDAVDGGAGTDALYFSAAPGAQTRASLADDAIILEQTGVQLVSFRNIERLVIVPDAVGGQGL